MSIIFKNLCDLHVSNILNENYKIMVYYERVLLFFSLLSLCIGAQNVKIQVK